jgi:hypothetical protein
MTTLILLTSHPGGLDNDLDQTTIIRPKNVKSFDEHSWTSNFFLKFKLYIFNLNCIKTWPAYSVL